MVNAFFPIEFLPYFSKNSLSRNNKYQVSLEELTKT